MNGSDSPASAVSSLPASAHTGGGGLSGEPLISVVIPCYDQAHFLSESIESVAGQSYPRYEVIVIDDGSTDETPAVAARYPWVRYLHQENQGLAAARNAGLRHASGEYVLFLDADDRLLPEALRAGKECLEANPSCAFVFGRFRRIAADGAVLSEELEDRPRPQDAYQAFLEGNFVAMHATVLYRRAAICWVGGFDPRLRECEDYDLYLRLARTHPIAEHRALVAEYRQHTGNMSAHAPRMLATVLGVLRSQSPHVQGNRSYRRSYRRGMRAWKDYYSEPLLHELRRYATRGEWRKAAQAASTLGRLCGLRLPVATLLHGLPPGLRMKLRQLRRHQRMAAPSAGASL